MKIKILSVSILLLVCFLQPNAYGVIHVSQATRNPSTVVNVCFTQTYITDLLVSDVRVRCRFTRASPHYDISSMWIESGNIWGENSWTGWVYSTADQTGCHCVSGTHDTYYLGLFLLREHTPNDCT